MPSDRRPFYICTVTGRILHVHASHGPNPAAIGALCGAGRADAYSSAAPDQLHYGRLCRRCSDLLAVEDGNHRQRR